MGVTPIATRAWAAAQVRTWYGHEPQGFQRFAAAFSAANAGALDAPAQLRAIAADASHPAIVRATALAQLMTQTVHARSKHLPRVCAIRNPLLRLAALQSLANAPLAARVSLAAPLLADPLKALRIEAVSLLAPVPADQLNAAQRAAFERASAEYVASQRYNADRHRSACQPRNLLCESRRDGESRTRNQSSDQSRPPLCSRIRQSCRPLPCPRARRGR